MVVKSPVSNRWFLAEKRQRADGLPCQMGLRLMIFKMPPNPGSHWIVSTKRNASSQPLSPSTQGTSVLTLCPLYLILESLARVASVALLTRLAFLHGERLSSVCSPASPRLSTPEFPGPAHSHRFQDARL